MIGPARAARGLLAVAALASAAAAFAQPAAPTPAPVEERVGVSLVLVPVSVVDRDGVPVPNLTAADFEVRADGKPVRIEAVDTIAYGRAGNPASGISTAAAVRKFLLLFDLTYATQSELRRAIAPSARFVREQMGELDVAAVATISAGGGVKLLQQLTPDRARLAETLESLAASDEWERSKAPSETMSHLIPSDAQQSIFQESEQYRRQLAGRLLGSLGALSRGLRPVPGRKYVVLFSHGFDPKFLTGDVAMPTGPRDLKKSPWGDTDTFGDPGLRSELEKVQEVFRREDCVLHAIDLGGVGGVSSTDEDRRVATFARNRESLAAIVRGTGGSLLGDSNDYENLLGRLLDETGAIYMVSFVPRPGGEPGAFHPLKVRVRAPRATVLARAGYYEPPPAPR